MSHRSAFFSRLLAGLEKIPQTIRVGSFLFLLLSSPLLASDAIETANETYANGKFEEAKVDYLHLVQEHRYSPELFYNLGNAWFRLGDFGRAILNYRRALILEPLFPEARANLKTSLKLAGNPLTPNWRDNLEKYADFLPVVVAVAFWVLLFIIVVRLLFHLPKGSLVWAISSVIAMVGIAALALIFLAGKGDRNPDRAIVVESAADLKYGPAVSARPIESLRVGDTVRLISSRGEWSFCEAHSGTVGWVVSQKVETLVP